LLRFKKGKMMSLQFAKNLVRFAALYNASALIIFLTPGGLQFFGINEPYSPFWIWLPSLLALFASIVLFFSSKDLHRYGVFPYWNGIIRMLFAVVAFLLDFKSGVGLFIGVIAVGDLILGFLCVISIPKALNQNHRRILLNKLTDYSGGNYQNEEAR